MDWGAAKKRTTIVINLTSIFEKADESILPAMFKYISKDFNATPAQMGGLSLCRGLTQALTTSLGGISGHLMDRVKVILIGCLIWSCMTAMFGLAKWIPHPMAFGGVVWSLNGLGLALVIPNAQSMIADYHTEGKRGVAFGVLYATAAFGAVIGSIYATNFAAHDVGGVRGWQIVMFTLAAVSLVVGVVNFIFGTDPRDITADVDDGAIEKTATDRGQWLDALRGIKSVITIPTFVIIIMQGVVGSMPWKAIASFGTLYFQLIGMSDARTSFLMSGFLIGTVLGGVLGGWFGDLASLRSPKHGRILVCQFSVFIGVPLTYMVFMVVPKSGSTGTFLGLLSLFFVEGLLISWAQPACNGPIFAEIVPAKKRTLIYAFDRCFEDALASPVIYLVGWASSALFGYSGEATATGNPEIDLPRAQAMGSAIMWFSVVPWLLCLVLYSGLHFTYPRDRDLARYTSISENSKGN